MVVRVKGQSKGLLATKGSMREILGWQIILYLDCRDVYETINFPKLTELYIIDCSVCTLKNKLEE